MLVDFFLLLGVVIEAIVDLSDALVVLCLELFHLSTLMREHLLVQLAVYIFNSVHDLFVDQFNSLLNPLHLFLEDGQLLKIAFVSSNIERFPSVPSTALIVFIGFFRQPVLLVLASVHQRANNG